MYFALLLRAWPIAHPYWSGWVIALCIWTVWFIRRAIKDHRSVSHYKGLWETTAKERLKVEDLLKSCQETLGAERNRYADLVAKSNAKTNELYYLKTASRELEAQAAGHNEVVSRMESERWQFGRQLAQAQKETQVQTEEYQRVNSQLEALTAGTNLLDYINSYDKIYNCIDVFVAALLEVLPNYTSAIRLGFSEGFKNSRSKSVIARTQFVIVNLANVQKDTLVQIRSFQTNLSQITSNHAHISQLYNAVEPYKRTIEAEYAKAEAIFYERNIKDSNSYYCLVSYLPTRATANEQEQQNRQLVWSFKDGRNSSEVAGRVASALLRIFPPTELRNMTFAVIPASSKDKNRIRYQRFCELVSEYTGMVNGFNCITVIQDRAALKGIANANKTGNLSYNSTLITGKTVLLFDDVMTSGTSFTQNAAQLKTAGATKAIGLFLARTVDTRIL